MMVSDSLSSSDIRPGLRSGAFHCFQRETSYSGSHQKQCVVPDIDDPGPELFCIWCDSLSHRALRGKAAGKACRSAEFHSHTLYSICALWQNRMNARIE